MAQEWREVLARRHRTSKTKRLYEDDQPTNKFSWDGMVGTSLHYEEVEGSGEWLEVDPRIVPSDEPGWDWEVRKSHWRFLVRNGGWFVAEKKGVGIGFRLERVAYLNIDTKEYQTIRTANYTTPTVTDIEHGNDLLANPLGKLTWTDLFPGVDFEIHISGDRLHEEIKVSQAARDAMPAPPYPAADTYLVLVYEVDWGQVPGLADDEGDIDYDADFERTARLYLKNHQGEIVTALPASKAWPEGDSADEDGEPIQVPLRKRFIKVGDQHYLLVGAPVLALNALPQGTIIFDPDINVSIGASADDADEDSTGFCHITPPGLRYGDYDYTRYVGTRWPVTIPTGQEITTAYIQWIADVTDSGSVEGDFYGEDTDTPAEFVNGQNDNISTRTPTTASVPWDNPEAWAADSTYTSPELKSIIQELVDTYDYSSGLNLVLIYAWNTGAGSIPRASILRRRVRT